MKRQNPMQYARKMGVVLGENCRLIGLPDWGSEPWLISIGNHTEVSFDVAFITHDGATWCFRDQDEYKGTLNSEEFELGITVLLVPAVRFYQVLQLVIIVSWQWEQW